MADPDFEMIAAKRAVQILDYQKALQVVWSRWRSGEPPPPGRAAPSPAALIAACPHPHRTHGSVFQADEWCADCGRTLDS